MGFLREAQNESSSWLTEPQQFVRNDPHLRSIAQLPSTQDAFSALSLKTPEELQELHWKSSLAFNEGLYDASLTHIGCIGFEHEYAEEDFYLNDILSNEQFGFEKGVNRFAGHFLSIGKLSIPSMRRYPFDSLYIGVKDLERFIPFVQENFGDGILINQTYIELATVLVNRFGFHIHEITEDFNIIRRKEKNISNSFPKLISIPRSDDGKEWRYTIFSTVSDLATYSDVFQKEQKKLEKLMKKQYHIPTNESFIIEQEVRMRFIVRNLSDLGFFRVPGEVSPQSAE